MDACLSLGFSEYFIQDLYTSELSKDQAGRLVTSSTPQSAVAPAPSKLLNWRHGEVRSLVFTLHDKELKQAQTGTLYALLTTDQGIIRAWKNTQERFNIGGTYKGTVKATN